MSKRINHGNQKPNFSDPVNVGIWVISRGIYDIGTVTIFYLLKPNLRFVSEQTI